MRIINIKSIAYILWMSVFLFACTPPSPTDEATEVKPKQSVMTGDLTARIASMHKLLRVPQLTLLDAQHVEQQYGDNGLGPADYQGFYYLQIPNAQLGGWIVTLRPIAQAPSYVAPEPSQTWWPSPAVFSRLKFYEVDALSHRVSGWVGVDAKTGKIYVFDFTT